MDYLRYTLCSKAFSVGDAFVILGIILLLLFSAFFSASETAFSASSQMRIKTMAEKKVRGARRALYVSDNFDKTLTTILVGNNIANIASTTLCAYLLGKYISSPTLANLINTIAMTIIVLTFGEILPKSLAKMHPEKTAAFVSAPLFVLMKILIPITFLFGLMQKSLHKKERSTSPTVTEDELENIINKMEEEGVLDSGNADIIQNALSFDELSVKDFMTHRVDMVAVNINASQKQVEDLFLEYQYSRMPVYVKDKDNVVGILNQKDFLFSILKNEKFNLKKLMSECEYVPCLMKADDLLTFLQKKKKQMAIVVDDQGGTAGMVTMEDLLEEMVGEIYDEHDDDEQIDFVKIGKNKYSVNPDITIEDLCDRLEIEHIPEFDSDTVGGMLIEKAGRFPKIGEIFEVVAIDDIFDDHGNYIQKYAHMNFQITKIDKKRITRVALEINWENK